MRIHTIIRRTLRVPRAHAPAGDGAAVARQLDSVLAGVGFTCSGELLGHVSGLAPHAATTLAVEVLGAVRELVGDDVEHNPYFLGFPHEVPDTVEFWVSCLRQALTSGAAVPTGGPVNLLDLPTYGRHQHTHAELLAAHDALTATAADRVTTLHLGDTVEAETLGVYRDLAGSTTPLHEADLSLLAQLAVQCRTGPQPRLIPVRENRAVINAVRLAAAEPLIAVDTVTDVLRVACRFSAGDVTLRTPTRFRSFRRAHRRVLLTALDAVAADEAKLADVARFAGRWKRLGERLHPHEYPDLPHAARVFAVARGDLRAPSRAARAEAAFAAGDLPGATSVLAESPGTLLRALDRLLRTATAADTDAVLTAVTAAVGQVSGRVLCSVREHLMNRAAAQPARVFVNRDRRGWVTPDTRPPLTATTIADTAAVLDAELARRLPTADHVVIDPALRTVAVPLTGAATEDGFAVLPRGSRTPVTGEVLRLFTHWRERAERTDFDLSALLLDADFGYTGHVSWTRFKNNGVVYSGDLTESANGATEFIDVPLAEVRATYLVPQVSIYCGEGFNTVAESMFGWMTRTRDQGGAPFEPRTVRTRSDLRGTGRVALPMVFARDDTGGWTALWTHLYLSGTPNFNQVEGHRTSTALLTRAVVGRTHLTVGHLIATTAGTVTTTDDPPPTGPVLYLGLEDPGNLPEGSTVITLHNLNRLVPA
ncbi:hypothetical protein UO65_2693 [Actinokineospora spheciospongiae]|uniref:TerD domain-containing protein n=1 Tax=Actinokineospora spheciospongiae TaxID=909613 RepID=W7IYL7_9PSEU|nr:TerD family protein [Actinokineospora spheciospongiae]EWC61982.1 hypothetical protein UO65_2693 [Actinokineospora spheciospongiae]